MPVGMKTAASLPSISAQRCSSLRLSPARKAIRRNAYFALKGRQSAHQPLGCLGFAIASQYHRNICVRRLWLHLITSGVTERTQFWSHLLGKEADGIEHALQRDTLPDV